MFALAKALKRNGVLGINARNAKYILEYNERRNYPLVDDKALTKELAFEHNVAVPDLYGIIEIQQQVKTLPDLLAAHKDFVIKPANGSQGEGIVVITGKTAGMYRKADGTLVSDEDLKFLVTNILSGIYSLGGQPDKALIEYRVQFDPVFEAIAFRGVPDVRIIIFLGVPVMAMVRLPTRMSDGKANLHRGCIGAGIDIATGKTLTAVWKNSIVTEHPDTGNPVSGVDIPQWQHLLEIAAGAYEMTNLGYQGIDLVLDKERGPLLLELNARPGLNIQIANREGLGRRLEIVEQHKGGFASIAERVAFARENFASRAIEVR
jgi:alpha-L-glutamate ligase-like protein